MKNRGRDRESQKKKGFIQHLSLKNGKKERDPHLKFHSCSIPVVKLKGNSEI